MDDWFVGELVDVYVEGGLGEEVRLYDDGDVFMFVGGEEKLEVVVVDVGEIDDDGVDGVFV